MIAFLFCYVYSTYMHTIFALVLTGTDATQVWTMLANSRDLTTPSGVELAVATIERLRHTVAVNCNGPKI